MNAATLVKKLWNYCKERATSDVAAVQRLLMESGGVRARIGALGACKELFRPWRMTTGEGAGG